MMREEFVRRPAQLLRVTRRRFLSCAAAAAGASMCPFWQGGRLAAAAGTSEPLVEARHYKVLNGKRVECELCPRKCRVADMERGYCGVRENSAGKYYTLVYSNVCALNIDPIEKKPFFHVLPGTLSYSLATAGCNIECKFCQNWQISQFRPEQVESFNLSPEAAVNGAISRGCPTIAFTYSEPVIFYEYMYDISALAKKRGVRGVMVSNGYITEKPLVELIQQLGAVKIDFKAFSDKFYREVCSGELKPVLDTLKLLKKSGIWFELVHLTIPTLNDATSELADLSKWIMDNLGPDVPIHFTRYHPTYKIKNIPSTPVSTLEKARNIATKAGIRYAYVGNVWGHEGEHTYCPGCKEPVVKRIGFEVLENKVSPEGKCGKCGTAIAGVWK